MAQPNAERAEAAHRNAGDAALQATGPRAVVGVDERHDLLNDMIAVGFCAVVGIDVPAIITIRHDHNRFGDLPRIDQIVDNFVGFAEKPFAIMTVETVQQVHARKTARGIAEIARR